MADGTDLSSSQKTALLEALEEVRTSAVNVERIFLGWELKYTLRKNGGSIRGDIRVIDPSDQQKIFSVIGLKVRRASLASRATCS